MSITNSINRNQKRQRLFSSSHSMRSSRLWASLRVPLRGVSLRFVSLICAIYVLALPWPTAHAAENPENGDIRNLKVGADVKQLPTDGYVDIRCARSTAQETKLSSWTEYDSCPTEDNGHTLVAFDYDDSKQQWAPVNDKWEGTKISGHPVLLSIAIDGDDKVVAINAKTDPEARAYLKKKAYLLSLRVKARYGRDGWTCTSTKPSEKETPVGGVFINEHCEKALPNRRIQLHTRLYRSEDQTLEESINSTEFKISTEES